MPSEDGPGVTKVTVRFSRKSPKDVVNDFGPGVPLRHRDCLFLEGYTSTNDHSKGRDLSTVRVQLTAFHGDLQYLPPATAGEGATFVIWFGIPNRYAPRPAGAEHEQVANTR